MEKGADSVCPCDTRKQYSACCKRYHAGDLPENARDLMRSRYSAYALGLVDYIVQTTHPKNYPPRLHLAMWRRQIEQFSRETGFEGLVIAEYIEEEKEAFVTFSVCLKQGVQDTSFTEKSHFVKLGDRWLYRGAQLITPIARSSFEEGRF